MTPKEKAAELVEKYKGIVYPYIGSSMLVNQIHEPTILRNAKICAIIAVDEVLNALPTIPYGIDYLQNRDYYEEVKQEIEKS